MKFIAVFVVLGLALLGCGGEPETIPPENENVTPIEAPVVDLTPDLDVGDLEAGIDFELTLAPEGGSETIAFEEMRSQKKKLNLGTITVEGSAPDALPVAIDLESDLDFANRPIAARGRLIRELESGEKEIIHTFETYLAGTRMSRMNAGEGEGPPYHFEADAVEGMTDLPETMLLYAEMDVVMMPKGTDPTTMDLATAEGGSNDTGLLLSNPVRVNFSIEQASAPEPAPESPAADADSAPDADGAPEADSAPLPEPEANGAPDADAAPLAVPEADTANAEEAAADAAN